MSIKAGAGSYTNVTFHFSLHSEDEDSNFTKLTVSTKRYVFLKLHSIYCCKNIEESRKRTAVDHSEKARC